jgi:hypothetical protein
VFRTHPFVSKLLIQLAPAAVVSAAGILLLSHLAKPVDPAPAAAVDTAVKGEMVFTPTPQAAVEAQAEESSAKPGGPARSAKAKPANAAPRKLAANESAPPPPPAAAPPLQLVPPQAAAPEVADTTMMGRLRGMGTAVRQMPQRAYGTVAGWFSEEAPPRPPAPVPVRNFL